MKNPLLTFLLGAIFVAALVGAYSLGKRKPVGNPTLIQVGESLGVPPPSQILAPGQSPAPIPTEQVQAPPPDYAQAINDVWAQVLSAAKASTVTLSNGAKQFNWKRYANLLVEINCAQCPADFQTAFTKFTRAVAERAGSDDLTTAAVGALELARLNPETISRIHQQEANVQTAVLECRQIATQYGVKISE